MKLLHLTPFFLALASGAAVTRKANYDGYQVVRLQVGDHLTRVRELIKDLPLSTWNGDPKADSTVDVVVPAAAVKTFDAEAAGEYFHDGDTLCERGILGFTKFCTVGPLMHCIVNQILILK